MPIDLGELLQQYGTLLSVSTSMALATWAYVSNRRLERKRYTFDLLMRYANSTELLRALHSVNRHIADGKNGGEPQDPNLQTHLGLLLPYFQSIALAANRGMLDRDIVLEARYGTMKAVWEFCRNEIETTRQRHGRPLLYVDLENYLRDNELLYRRYITRELAARNPLTAQTR